MTSKTEKTNGDFCCVNLKPFHFMLLRPLTLSTLLRNVITSSRKSKTMGGGLTTVPYKDRNFLAILYFKSQTKNLDRLCE